MKKIIIILGLILSTNTKAQEIEYRSDEDNSIVLGTTMTSLQTEPYVLKADAVAIVTKDTVTADQFALAFLYKTPKEIELDSSSTVEIRFSDGLYVTYPYDGIKNKRVPKDSAVDFAVMTSYNTMFKITKMPISEIIFTTPLYTRRFIIEDRMKLRLPNLVNYLFKKVAEEYEVILDSERSKNVPAIEFDATANNKLDRKYFGTYSGEWNWHGVIYNFDLTIGYDTSYIVWHIVKDPAEENPNRIKTQLLNIRKENVSNLLVLDVCYDPTKEDYTNGRRTFYLKLSENGQVIYGSTHAFDRWGEMYGLRKSR